LGKALRVRGDSPNATAEFEKASLLGFSVAAAELPWWPDPATGLRWTRQDNGGDVNWNQASSYCQNLGLGGYSNWRLPTIDELAGIYDPSGSGWHIKGGIKLSSNWVWSSSRSSGEVWSFVFIIGERNSFSLGYSNLQRALCVRRSGE
jgi:hypothetical protein